MMFFVQFAIENHMPGVESYREHYRKTQRAEAPPVHAIDFTYCDRDAGRAEETARKYITAYYLAVLRHYEFLDDYHAKIKGYEAYGNAAQLLREMGKDNAAEDFVSRQAWGTPQQILDKLEKRRRVLSDFSLNICASYAGLPADAKRACDCRREVLPGSALGKRRVRAREPPDVGSSAPQADGPLGRKPATDSKNSARARCAGQSRRRPALAQRDAAGRARRVGQTSVAPRLGISTTAVASSPPVGSFAAEPREELVVAAVLDHDRDRRRAGIRREIGASKSGGARRNRRRRHRLAKHRERRRRRAAVRMPGEEHAPLVDAPASGHQCGDSPEVFESLGAERTAVGVGDDEPRSCGCPRQTDKRLTAGGSRRGAIRRSADGPASRRARRRPHQPAGARFFGDRFPGDPAVRRCRRRLFGAIRAARRAFLDSRGWDPRLAAPPKPRRRRYDRDRNGDLARAERVWGGSTAAGSPHAARSGEPRRRPNASVINPAKPYESGCRGAEMPGMLAGPISAGHLGSFMPLRAAARHNERGRSSRHSYDNVALAAAAHLEMKHPFWR
jgi:hypothetical protein